MTRRSRAAILAAMIGLLGLESLAALDVVTPSSTVLGGSVTVYVPASASMRSVEVGLYDSAGGAVDVTSAFPYAASPSSSVWVAIIGIPTTIEPGRYEVRTRVVTVSGVEQQASPVTVDSREFRHESIALNQSLTVLQTEDTAVKREQAAQLWRILTRFDGAAVYQTGPLIMPVEGYIVTSPYGERRDYLFAGGGKEPDIHQGIDLAVAAGTTIRADGAGRVVFAGSWLMTGNTVVIEQLPGVYSLYFHMERMLVQPGQVVKQGEAIGLVGSTGLATGPHLHWQIEIGGVAVDPLRLLKDGLVSPAEVLVHSK